jgi:hypothetical protein
MPNMAIKRNSQSVRRLHQARRAKAAGEPSKLKTFLCMALAVIVGFGGLLYSTSRIEAGLETRAAQPSTEEQAARIRNSLNGSTVDAAIKKSEGF